MTAHGTPTSVNTACGTESRPSSVHLFLGTVVSLILVPSHTRVQTAVASLTSKNSRYLVQVRVSVAKPRTCPWTWKTGPPLQGGAWAPELLTASLPARCQERPQRENRAQEKMRAGVLLTRTLSRSSWGQLTWLLLFAQTANPKFNHGL